MHEFPISYNHTEWYFIFSDSATKSAQKKILFEMVTHANALVSLYQLNCPTIRLNRGGGCSVPSWLLTGGLSAVCAEFRDARGEAARAQRHQQHQQLRQCDDGRTHEQTHGASQGTSREHMAHYTVAEAPMKSFMTPPIIPRHLNCT